MRKNAVWIISVLVLLFVGLLGAGFWWWKVRQAEDFARYLPSETLGVFYVPDGIQTGVHYQGSNLKKVIECPEGRAVTSALLGFFATNLEAAKQEKFEATLKGVQKTLDIFWPNLAGKTFAAVTRINPAEPLQSGAIVGFSPYAGTAAFEPFWLQCKELLTAEAKEAVTFGSGEYNGIPYETVEKTGEKGSKLCKAIVGKWAIVTYGEPTLQEFINRFQGKDSSPTLAQYSDYKKVQKNLGPYDLMIYGNITAGINVGLQVMAASPMKDAVQKEPFTKLAEIYREFPAFGGKLVFDGPLLRTQWVVLNPKELRTDLGASQIPGKLKMVSYTSDDTVFYEGARIELKKQWAVATERVDPQAKEILKTVEATLKNSGIDLQTNVFDALGTELALIVDWTPMAPAPEVGVLVEIAKPDAFKPVIDAGLKLLQTTGGTNLVLTDSTAGSIPLKTVTLPVPYVSPTFTTSGNLLGIFTTRDFAQRLLSKNGGKTLYDQAEFMALKSPPFEDVLSGIYVNTPRIVDHCYIHVKTFWPSAMAFMPPKISQTIGKTQLPDKLSFSGDMGAWMLSTEINDEAILMKTVSGAGSPLLPLFVAGVAVVSYQGIAAGHAHEQAVAAGNTAPVPLGASSVPPVAPVTGSTPTNVETNAVPPSPEPAAQ